MQWDVLEAWMNARGLGAGPINDVRQLTGGTQNDMTRFRRGERDEYVLRMPPPFKRTNSDETMRRESRMLAALDDSDVPHPELIAAEPDESLLGCAFYLMRPVEGCVATTGWTGPLRTDTLRRRRVGLSAAEAIASLGTIDFTAAGLANFGRHNGFLERQARRWRAAYDMYWTEPGYGEYGLEIDDVEVVEIYLDQHRPTGGPPGIVHGDMHLGNLIVADSGDVAAIVDWELATIGDPLLDLAHLLICWPDRSGGGPFVETFAIDCAGLASEAQIVSCYEKRSGRDVSALRWYKILAAYRLAILVEGTNVRAARGEAPRRVGDQMHRLAKSLLRRAREEVES